MKVTYTPKGNVKIILTEDEACALAGVLVNSPASPEDMFIGNEHVKHSEYALTRKLSGQLGEIGLDGV